MVDANDHRTTSDNNDLSFMSADTSISDKEFEFVSFPPPPSGDVIPLNDVLYINGPRGDDVSGGAAAELQQESIAFRCPPLKKNDFDRMFDKDGRIVDEQSFRNAVFRGGSDAEIRPDVWSFLFNVYPCMSTVKERQAIFSQKFAHYNALKERWQSFLLSVYPTFDLSQFDNCVTDERPAYDSFVNRMKSTSSFVSDVSKSSDFYYMEAKIFAQRFKCDINYVVDSLRYISKDVPRTDRTHIYYAGDHNPHLLTLRDALMTFCFLHPEIGYVQGMNDLLARFFVVFDCEVMALWSFNNYIENVQKDFLAEGMVQKINSLSSLLEKLDADLFHYLHVHGMSDMIFCHKWLLLCFQREFQFDEGLRLLEIVSTRHIETNTLQGQKTIENCRRERVDLGINVECDLMFTDHTFDLFICVAILTLYRDKIFRATDGAAIFQTISQLTGNLVLDRVLYQAERLFYSYCHSSLLYSF